ncbi:hypothetical protein G6F22_021391 [Rhizopus arrhizus]|nr:hypothetical protein G6F22_021391 [Rhizopus arrhizus]
MDQGIGVLACQRRVGGVHRRLGSGAVARCAIELVEAGLAGRQILRLGGGACKGQGRARKGKHGAVHVFAPYLRFE